MSYSLALLKWVCCFNWLQCDCLCEWAKLWLWGSISQSLRQNNHSGVSRPLVFSRLPAFNLIRSVIRRKKNKKKKKKRDYQYIFFKAWLQHRAEMWAQSCLSPAVGCSNPFSWGQSSPEHKSATELQYWELREGINPSSHSLWGSALLYLGEAWDVWPLQLHVSVEGSRQLPSCSWTAAGYCTSGMCIASSGRNHHIKWVSLPHMEIFSQWSFWGI